MTRLGITLGAALLVVLAHAAPASAQARPAAARDRFEGSLGGLWIAGAGLGSADAALRANNTTPTPFRLFTTESRAAAAAGLDARAAYWLTRTVAVEGGFVRARPALRTRITADAEGAPDQTVEERLDQYFVEGNVVWLLERFRLGATVPFLSGGAGYLRQLHEGRTLVQTGQVFQLGGGLRHQLLESSGWIGAVGLRLQGRVYVLNGGVQLEDRPRTHAALSGALYLAF